jgi:hypothetical protein
MQQPRGQLHLCRPKEEASEEALLGTSSNSVLSKTPRTAPTTSRLFIDSLNDHQAYEALLEICP